MKNEKAVIEQCPKCGRDHERGEFRYYVEANRDAKTRDEHPTRTYACAPDIRCECGLDLAWVVPFFAYTNSGYALAPKPDHRAFREANGGEACE